MATVNANALIDADDVKEVIDTGLDDAEINRFINMAYFISLPLASRLGNCGGSGALAEIQVQLAAHFISIGREPQVKNESIGGEASASYRGTTGQGLKATLYGQAAIDLDCSGTLAKSGLKKASFRVWDHEDIDYDAEYENA